MGELSKRVIANLERRQAPRESVRARAKIVYGQGAFSIACTIRDISATGACVILPEGQTIPDEVQLFDCENNAAYFAKVVWRLPPLIALTFGEDGLRPRFGLTTTH